MWLWLILAVILLLVASVGLGALLASRWQREALRADAALGGRLIERMPADVRADLRGDVRRRSALVLGMLLPIVAAVVFGAYWASTSTERKFPEGISIGCLVLAVIPILGELLATVVASRRAGATLLDLGEHPMAASQKLAGSMGLCGILLIAVINAGANVSRNPVLAALWGVLGLTFLTRSVLFRSKVLLTEGGVRMFSAFYPWSALERPTWGEGRTVVALRRTGALARLWSTWLIIPVPEGRADEVESLLASRLTKGAGPVDAGRA